MQAAALERIAHLASTTIICHASNNHWRVGPNPFAIGGSVALPTVMSWVLLAHLDLLGQVPITIQCESDGPKDPVLVSTCAAIDLQLATWPTFTVLFDGETVQYRAGETVMKFERQWSPWGWQYTLCA